MHLITGLFHEIVRFQALVFIAHASPVSPPTPRELSRHLGIQIEACEDVLDGLVEDGFIDPRPELRLVHEDPLWLTPIGAGWLRWMREHAAAGRR
jgi:DNA-binding MarR family transcriptional regulator